VHKTYTPHEKSDKMTSELSQLVRVLAKKRAADVLTFKTELNTPGKCRKYKC